MDPRLEHSIATAPQNEGIIDGMHYRVQIRVWFNAEGKYEGDKSEWQPCNIPDLIRATSGDFYGEWHGARWIDGGISIRNSIMQAIQLHRDLINNAGFNPTGTRPNYPIRLDTWGEYRIITTGR